MGRGLVSPLALPARDLSSRRLYGLDRPRGRVPADAAPARDAVPGAQSALAPRLPPPVRAGGGHSRRTAPARAAGPTTARQGRAARRALFSKILLAFGERVG